MTNSYQFSLSDSVSTEDVSVAVERRYPIRCMWCCVTCLDSCHRMGSMGMLYFLYLSRGNLWQGPSFVPSFQDGYWYVLGVRLNKHNTFVWYPQTVSLSPWWAGNTVWGFKNNCFLTCTSVICLVLKSSVATVVSSLNLSLFYCSWKVCFMACGTSQ